MLEKRYQVFLSSTYTDLKEERQEVISALIRRKCFPVAMEYFPAMSRKSIDYIKDAIRECDFYVLIVAGRYGSSLDENGVSLTEIEFDYAQRLGIPTNIYLYDGPPLPSDKIEDTDDGKKRLKNFIQKLKATEFGYNTWTNKDNLASVVKDGIEDLKKSAKAIGWVRANAIPAATPQTPEGQRAVKNKYLKDLCLSIDKRLNDEVEIETEITFSSSELISFSDGKYYPPYDIHHVFKCTWRDVFFAFAYKIDSRRSEDECIVLIKEMLKEKFAEQINEHLMDGYDKIKIDIDSSGIYSIRIEFIVNNLVNVTTIQNFHYWHISEFGAKYLHFIHNAKFHPSLYR